MNDLFDFIGGGTLAVLIVIVILVLLVAYVTGRFKVAGANEALVRTGGLVRAPAQLKVVRAGRVVVLPLVHKLGRLHLSARLISVSLPDAVTKQGIKVAVQGVATVKIGGDEESIRNAAERFVDREDQIESIVKNVLEGSLRSIVGTLTVEELNYDRQKFQQEVQSAAKGDLATSGLTIDNFTIQAIRDEVGYMDLIGQQETARRERDARMAKASADQEAAVREAEAQQVKLNAQRDVALRQADVEAQTASAEAKAAQAGPLAQAEAQQEVTRRQTELAQLEADRTEKELVATTVRPAEAEATAQIRRAEGDKQARIASAQADAERVKLAGQAEASVSVTKGEAQARVVAVNAEAQAQKTTLEGNAEAGITFTKGEAEAKALGLRADAYRQFNEAAIISTVLSMLPDIVRAAAEPISAIDNLTVLSSEGASDVVKTTTRTVAEASATVKGLTGIDVPQLLSNALGATDGGVPPTGGGAPPSRPGGGGRGPGGGRRPAQPTPAGGASARSRGAERPPTPGVTHAPAEPLASAAAPEPTVPSATAAEPTAPAVTAPEAAAAQPAAPGEPSPEERIARSEEAVRSATARASRATPGASALGGLTSPLPPHPPVSDVRPSDRRRRAVDTAARAAGLSESSTLDEAANRLAEELRVIPGIERFGGTRLADLEQSGPRTLRTLWGAAKQQLGVRYGDLTIGALLDRYEQSRGGQQRGR